MNSLCERSQLDRPGLLGSGRVFSPLETVFGVALSSYLLCCECGLQSMMTFTDFADYLMLPSTGSHFSPSSLLAGYNLRSLRRLLGRVF